MDGSAVLMRWTAPPDVVAARHRRSVARHRAAAGCIATARRGSTGGICLVGQPTRVGLVPMKSAKWIFVWGQDEATNQAGAAVLRSEVGSHGDRIESGAKDR